MWLNTSRGHLPLHCSWQSLKFAKFQSVKNKASSKRSILCPDTSTLPSPRLNNLSFLERKHQLGVSRMGIWVQRYIKYLKCHSFSGTFLERKAKKIDVGAHKNEKWMLENKERAEKQLLTVNSVNPSCSSALNHFKILSILPAASQPSPYPEPRTVPLPLE